MLKVGITGGIGSGKTTVCQIFEVLGVPVFYADKAAKLVMHSDETLIAGIRENFGDEAYSETGRLNRKHLADIVFNDEKELEKLNTLVHPAVFRAFDVWIKNRGDVPYVIKEAALLFESGSYRLCDYTILVKSPAELKIRRVMWRDGVTKNDVELRMNKQFTDDKKAGLADFTLINDEKKPLVPQVINMHGKFLELAFKS